MGTFETPFFVGSAKFLAKWLIQRYLGDAPWAEAVASELGGEVGKRSFARFSSVFKALFTSVTTASNPEFEGRGINCDAVDKEVEVTLDLGLNDSVLADASLNFASVFKAVKGSRSPVGLGEAETALYEVVLAEAVKIACDAASASSEFRKEVDARLLDRSSATVEGLRRLGVQVDAIVDSLQASKAEIREIKTALKELTTKATDAEFEYQYAAALLAELNEVHLFGIDERIPREARTQKLSTAYLSLNLTDEQGSSAPVSFEELFGTLEPKSRPFLLVRGDAGSGKSTLLKRMAIVHAEFAVADVTFADRFAKARFDGSMFDTVSMIDRPRDFTRKFETYRVRDELLSLFSRRITDRPRYLRIPIFVPLRRCTKRRLPPLKEITSFAADGLPVASDDWVQRVLLEGRGLFLIDGLDEVAPQNRKEIDAGLESWFKQFEPMGNLFIVTSRPLVKDPDWVQKFKFREARVAPMSRPAREQFIEAWHLAVREKLEEVGKPETIKDAKDLPKKAEALKEKLRKRRGVAHVASNPLMCAMICALNTDANYDVDRSPREIIDTLCKVLVHEREKATPHLDTDSFPKCYRTLTADQRLEVLGNLALEMIMGSMPVAGFEVLEKRAKAMLGGIGGAPEKDAAELAETLIERSGLLVKSKRPSASSQAASARRTTGTRPDVDWIHATFKEFLAAEQMSLSHVDFLLQNWKRPDVRNVCVHVAARRGSQEIVDRLLTRILGEAAPKRDSVKKPKATKAQQELQRQREYLALRIGDAAVSIDPAIRKRLDKIRTKLMPPVTLAAAEALAPLGEEIIPDLRWNKTMQSKPRVLQACVRALRLIEHEDAKEAMREHAQHAEDMSVIGELSEAINPLEIPLVLTRVTTTPPDGVHRFDDEWLPISIRKHIGDAAPLLRMPNITQIDLADTRVTDAGVKDLAHPDTGLKALTSLDLTGAQVTDAGVKDLARPDTGLKSLTSLDLRGTQVTDAGVKDLAHPDTGLKALTSLELGYTKVTDAGVKDLARPDTGLKALTSLHLTSTQVTDAGVKDLARPDTGLKALTTLNLWSTRVTDAGVKDLARPDTGFKALTSLDLTNTQVTNAGVKDLARPDTGLKALTTLNLWSTQVTDAGVKDLARPDTGLKALTSLNLSYTKVTDAGVKDLAHPDTGLKALTAMDLSFTKMTDAGVKDLANPDTGLKALTSLNLSYTKVTDAGVKDLAHPDTGLKALTSLDLRFTKVTDAGVKDLAHPDTGLKALTTLTLIGTKVTDAGVTALRARFPELSIVR